MIWEMTQIIYLCIFICFSDSSLANILDQADSSLASHLAMLSCF